MGESSDPRVYFAAERTLLAWVRTGLAVIGLGFVVARFGIYLRLARHAEGVETHPESTAIGFGLVLLGSASVGMAAWQHARFSRQLAPNERPRSYVTGWSVVFAGCLAAIGIVLAVYIVMRANMG